MESIVSFAAEKLLSGLALSVARTHAPALSLSPASVSEEGAACTWTYPEDAVLVSVSAEAKGETAVFSLDASIRPGFGPMGAFASADAVRIPLGTLVPDALNANYRDKPWWMIAAFPKTFADIPATTQSLLIRAGGKHIHLLMLTGDNFRAELEQGFVTVSSDMAGLTRLSGPFLAVTAADDPYTAIAKNFAFARETGALRVPLREDREMPALFNGFGYCTWNTFYAKVDAAGVYAKLAEFKEKNIPVKWMILDDGWLTTRDSKLAGFEINAEKFPEGLKAFVDRVKGEYGIEKVGVWHAFNGYWNGVDPESPLYEVQKENLLTTPAGLVVPSLDEEKAFRFWDAWHTYLAESGVDFVKVDNQSSNSGMLEGAAPTAEACRVAHAALERSVFKHFGGAIINCMGMNMENNLARPRSAVSRNSDDFFPNAPRGFVKHLVQNAYNAMTFGQLYYCDFDMWWTHHESAAQSGVLRAIAGSPIYISDEVGSTCLEYILPLIEEDGSLMLCDGTAQPTADCVYTDCPAEGRFLKVWNTAGSAFGLAAFNVAPEEKTEQVRFGDIPGLGGRYVAREYFSGAVSLVDASSQVEITLPGDGQAVWSLYPVEGEGEDAFVWMGSSEKYLPIASKNKEKKTLKELNLA